MLGRGDIDGPEHIPLDLELLDDRGQLDDLGAGAEDGQNLFLARPNEPHRVTPLARHYSIPVSVIVMTKASRSPPNVGIVTLTLSLLVKFGADTATARPAPSFP